MLHKPKRENNIYIYIETYQGAYLVGDEAEDCEAGKALLLSREEEEGGEKEEGGAEAEGGD